MIASIIFDLDGVLIDLCDIHKKVFQKALLIAAGISIEDKFHDESLNGLPTRVKLDKIGIVGRTAIDVANLKQELTVKELENIQEDVELREILLDLSDGFDLYCASNSIRATVEKVLTKLNIIDLFEAYYGNDDVFMAKPSPEMYLKCMVQTPCMRTETLVIEDSLIGEETIKNAGCHGLIIKNRKELTFDRIMDRINEIEK